MDYVCVQCILLLCYFYGVFFLKLFYLARWLFFFVCMCVCVEKVQLFNFPFSLTNKTKKTTWSHTDSNRTIELDHWNCDNSVFLFFILHQFSKCGQEKFVEFNKWERKSTPTTKDRNPLYCWQLTTGYQLYMSFCCCLLLLGRMQYHENNTKSDFEAMVNRQYCPRFMPREYKSIAPGLIAGISLFSYTWLLMEQWPILATLLHLIPIEINSSQSNICFIPLALLSCKATSISLTHLWYNKKKNPFTSGPKR